MKLSEAKPYFESSNDMQEHFFSIEDQGMIFDILRSKMYSNPILAICREISSNARDAHREVGRQDIPVHIHLPTGLEPEYKIKDFGPGISPDRMVNIFIKYTASTKRGDNVQTGGFGLGAKTPFAYSDQFTVTTVHDRIKYSYVCSIDETKVGKLSLLDKRPCDEPNSTEITIPIKHQDFGLFRQYTEQSCRHWDVKPIITGGNIEWTVFSKVLEGQGWAIAKTTDWQRHAKLVIDGIEYPLDLDTLRKYADTKLIDSAQGHFVMYFGVGELSLSANREQIFLDKPTQEKISKRMAEITKEIKQKVIDKIDSFPNLWEANVFYRRELNQAFNNLGFLGKLTWKGNELSNGCFTVVCPVFDFTRGKYSRKYGSDPNKLTRSAARAITFEEHAELYINDLPIKEPTPRHLKKAFDDNPALKTVHVICPNDKQSEEDLNKTFNLDKMMPKKLSSITKASARAYTAPASRLLVFKFDSQAGAFRQVSYDSMDEDTNEKVLCSLGRDSNNLRLPSLSSSSVLGLSVLKVLTLKNPKISFYGVDSDVDAKRVDKEFNDFIKLSLFIDDNVLNNTTINYVEIKYAQTHVYDVDERMLKHHDRMAELITDPNSLFLKRLTLHKKVKNLSGGDKSLLEVYESVKGSIAQPVLDKFAKDNPAWDLKKLEKEYDTKYPLMDAITTYNLVPFLEHLAQYVNMIDKI
jgi:hypothetical protein